MSAIKGRKHCDKRRNCLLQEISPFLNVFHGYISLVRQNVALCGNELILTVTKKIVINNASKNIVEKVVKMLVTSIFPFSHSLIQHSNSQILLLEPHFFRCIKMLSKFNSLKIPSSAKSSIPHYPI